MPEQAVCKCGQRYSPQDWLTQDRAACPSCGQELCLATCGCGKPLTNAHRQAGVSKSEVEFKCPDCGKVAVAQRNGPSSKVVIALGAAVLLGAIGAGLAWSSNCSPELVLLAGLVCAILGAASFYIRDLFPFVRV